VFYFQPLLFRFHNLHLQLFHLRLLMNASSFHFWVPPWLHFWMPPSLHFWMLSMVCTTSRGQRHALSSVFSPWPKRRCSVAEPRQNSFTQSRKVTSANPTVYSCFKWVGFAFSAILCLNILTVFDLSAVIFIIV